MEEELILIKRAINGNQESFSKIIDIYKNYVFAIILNFIKDHSEAENVAQEVFIQIYLSLSQYDNRNFKGWIGRIATNKSIDWLREKKRKFPEETREDTQEIVDIIEKEKTQSPESLLMEKEKKRELNQILDSLPKIYGSTIRKFYFEEKSYEEIAMEEEVSIKTIESRLYRGRNMFKEKWRERP